VDGPVHDFPDRQVRDKAKTTQLDDLDYTVLRFGHQDDWLLITQRFPHVFGSGKATRKATKPTHTSVTKSETLDLELFTDEWQPIIQDLFQCPDLTIEPGADVQRDGRVIGSYIAVITKQGKSVYIVASTNNAQNHVASQLQSQGLMTLIIDPGFPDAVQRIIASLEAA